MSRARAAIAVAMVFLLVASTLTAPAAADAPDAATSVHDTAVDFEAGTLNGFGTEGSGASAELVLGESLGSYDWDDGTAQGWTLNDRWSTESASYEGSNSIGFVEQDIFNEASATAYTPDTYQQGWETSFWVKSEQSEAGGKSSELRYGDWRVEISEDGTSIVDPNGNTVDSAGGYSQNKWVQVEAHMTESGVLHAEIISDGSVLRTLEHDTGDTGLSSRIGIYRMSGYDSRTMFFVDSFRISEYDPGDGTYVSATHNAQAIASGAVDFTQLENATVTATWETYDGGSWQTLEQRTFTSAGLKRASWQSTPSDQVRLTLSAVAEQGTTRVSVDSESVISSSFSSEHTSADDLLNASQLVMLDVKGTGDAAYADYEGGASYAGNASMHFDFESGTSHPPTELVQGLSTSETGSPTYVSGLHGDHALEFDESNNDGLWVTEPFDPDSNGEYTLHARVKSPTPSSQDEIFWWDDGLQLRFQDGEMRYYHKDASSNWHLAASPSVSANTAYDVGMTWDGSTVKAYLDGSQVGSSSVSGMETDTPDGGQNVLIIGNGDNANSPGMTGVIDEPRLWDEALSASQIQTLDSDPDYQYASETGDAIYLGDTHEVENPVNGEVDVGSYSDVTAYMEWQYHDGTGWQTAVNQTISSAGTHSASLSGYSGTEYRVRVFVTDTSVSSEFDIQAERVTFENSPVSVTAQGPADGTTLYEDTVTLEANVQDDDFTKVQGETVETTFYWNNGSVIDTVNSTSAGTVSVQAQTGGEGTRSWYAQSVDSRSSVDSTSIRSFTVQHFAPVIDESTMTPEGELEDSEETFTVDLDDDDFLYQGDTLNASLYIDGEYQGSDTLTQPGEASVTAPIGFGGTVEYYWNVTDDYDHAVESQRLEIQTPGSIEIREATGDHSLIQNADGKLEFYSDPDGEPDAIYTRSSSDGVVEMGGLPKNQSFVVVASAPNHTTRRVYITSLFETSTVYLPHENETVVQPKFKLNDFTSDFPGKNTVMEIQRNVQGEWRTVEGDRFSSVNQFTSTLLFNERHRLSITNVKTGQTRDLGQFTPTESGTVTLRVSGREEAVAPDYEPVFNFQPDGSALPRQDNVTVNVTVEERDTDMSGYTVTFTSDGTTVATREVSGAVDSAFTLNLSTVDGASLNATVDWTAADGGTGTVEKSWSLEGEFSGATGLLDAVEALGIGTGVGSLLTLVIMGLTVGFAAPRLPPIAAAGAGVGVAVGGTLIGWLPAPILTVIAATYGVLVLSEVNT